MNLEQLIDEAYNKYQAQLKAKAEAQVAFEKKEVEKAIALFRSYFDAVVSQELQQALGIKVCAIYQEHQPYAFFEYRGVQVVIRYGPYNGGEWGVKDDLDQYLDHIPSEKLIDYLLTRLGEIRLIKTTEPESKIIEQAASFEMLQKFNQFYIEIQAIAQSEEWQKLCEKKHNDPEMKTHLGDVLHYLGEVMDCVEVKAKQDE